MYTISKPNCIFAKTRRSLTQNYDKFDTIKEINKKSNLDKTKTTEEISVPRPVFQTHKKNQHKIQQIDEEVLTPQHEEIIQYITESWNMVVAQNPYDKPASQDNNNSSAVVNSSSAATLNSSSLYCVEPPSPILSDFKPFDLESWWGRRLFNNITKNL